MLDATKEFKKIRLKLLLAIIEINSANTHARKTEIILNFSGQNAKKINTTNGIKIRENKEPYLILTKEFIFNTIVNYKLTIKNCEILY